MLARRYRLHKNYQFRYVYAHGAAVSDRVFTLIYCPSRRSQTTFGFSVSKRNGKATKRNRLKRLMRESVRLTLPEVRPGFNAVLAVSSKYVFDGTLTYAAAAKAIRALLTRAGLIAPTAESD